MTAALANISRPRYGALKLKQSYQLNLGLALLAAFGLHIAVVPVAHMLLNESEAEGIVKPPPIFCPPVDFREIIIEPGPPLIIIEEGRPFSPPVTKSEFEGLIPKAVEDYSVEKEPGIWTQEDWAGRYGDPVKIDFVGTGNGGGQPGTVAATGQESGSGYIFTSFEKPPVPIKRVMPVYPRVALLTGTGGKVLLAVRIDVQGNVVEAGLESETAPGLGFREAALAAIYGWKFRPAVMNGHPVEVWYHIPIVFEIEP